MLEIDHVILAVPSLDSALEKLQRDNGLVGIRTPVDDGPIETAIVPFETDQYLEVLALKTSVAAEGPLAVFADRLREQGSFFWGFAVRAEDLESVSARVDCPLSTFEGKTVCSKTVRPQPSEANGLPFFIEYLDGTGSAYLDGLRQNSSAPVKALRYSRIELSTSRARLEEWLGVGSLGSRGVSPLPGLVVVDGSSGIVSIEIETRDGRIEILSAAGMSN